LHKWAIESSRDRITANVSVHGSCVFTCVRNPDTRVLSSFFDKICGIQRNGRRYRGTRVPLITRKHGIEVGGADGSESLDQIRRFRRVLLFARDTIRWKRPMEPDIHGSGMSGHASTFIVNGGRYDRIFWTERFDEGMGAVLSAIDTPHAVDLDAMPRFNDSVGHRPRRAHPVEAHFDDLSMHLVYEICKHDLELFRYDPADPVNKMPVGEIDLDEVHAKLGDWAARGCIRPRFA
jgi:hypothetical protein